MNPITLLLTGYIGSGKTTVAKYLSERYGIPVFYSDEEAKRLYDDPKFLSQVNEIVGGGIIANDGTLNKKALAEIIFSDETKKQQVEALVHPKVRENFRLWKETKISPIVIMESAIALQNGREGFDYVILVDAPESVRLERTMKRDNSSKEKILARMKSQKIDLSLVDFTIYNEFDFKDSADDLICKLIDFSGNKALFAGQQIFQSNLSLGNFVLADNGRKGEALFVSIAELRFEFLLLGVKLGPYARVPEHGGCLDRKG